MAESRNYLRETPDERRRRRKEALIDAALTLTHTGGLSALGVRNVIAQSKLSSRYFYENFTGTDDLLVEAFHQVATDLLETGMAGLYARQLTDPGAASEEEILERFRQGLDAVLGALEEDPRRAALIAAVTASGPPIRQELQQLVRLVATVITDDVNAADIGFDHASALYIAGGLVQLAIAHISGDLQIGRPELVERLARLTYGALTASAADRIG
ncbi:TetR/AcrR family transcriptional regulator [Nocardia sp. AB354]|uniref:TetR/AcrR family transcriptional regulator n=1 Tax=Nocardia sp. AB354 TaxID=3413283 RepID=UPI003C2A6F64